jgi:ParB-like chromosome segregation protein Spo0J
MATAATKEKKKKKKGTDEGAPAESNGKIVHGKGKYTPQPMTIEVIDISKVVSNSENPRESIPALTHMGYGVFTKLEGSDKQALVPLGTSEKKEDKEEYVKLMHRFEPDVVKLSESLRSDGMLQHTLLRPSEAGGAKDANLDLIFGCRRLLAALLTACEDAINDEIPADEKSLAAITGYVTEETDERARAKSIAENIHRLNMDPMEQAKIFMALKKEGKSVDEIEEITKVDHQTVRTRMHLLKLDPELQQKVSRGDLPVTKALAIVKGKSDPKTPGATGKGPKGDNKRRSAPTINDWRDFYTTRKVDSLWTESVRKFIAKEILQVDYLTLEKLEAEEEKARAAKEKADKNK